MAFKRSHRKNIESVIAGLCLLAFAALLLALMLSQARNQRQQIAADFYQINLRAQRLQAVLRGNAERMARRLVKEPAANIEIIAEALALPPATVERWARETIWTRETATTENIAKSLMDIKP